MDVYLNDIELLREQNLFAPAEASYTRLEGKTYNIRSFKEEVVKDSDMPEIPPS